MAGTRGDIVIRFEEIDYTNSELNVLLEILGLYGHFNEKGLWVDAKKQLL